MKLLIGVILAGAIGPALGVSGNLRHDAWGMIVAAVCFSVAGIALILHEVLARRT